MESQSVFDFSLAEKGQEFADLISRKTDEGVFKKEADLGWMMEPLDQLSILDGYVLDAYRSIFLSHNWNAKLYVHKKGAKEYYDPDPQKYYVNLPLTHEQEKEIYGGENKCARYMDSLLIEELDSEYDNQIPEIWDYLTVPFTPMGLWQAYLLKDSYTLLPAGWHGNYNRRIFIYDNSTVEWIKKRFGDSFTESQIKGLDICIESLELLPQVSISRDIAVISYSYWSNRGGLSKRGLVALKKGKTVKFCKEESYKNIVHYDWGIRF